LKVLTDIWIPTFGSEYVIDMTQPYFSDVRKIFIAYGNTVEARECLKKIQKERNKKISWIENSPIEYIKLLVENNKGITKESIIELLEIYINEKLGKVKHYCLPMELYTCRINYFIEKYGK
jgi:hypothetical protein